MIKNPQFSGNAIGLILPNDILDVEKQEFEAILQNLTKADQELKQYEECLEYSEQVSEGLKKGAEYVGRGMVKGAIKSSEWMYLGKYFFRIYTLYNAILRIARNFLETKENIKISTHPFYHINLD